MTLKLNLTNPAVKKGAFAVVFYIGFLIACYLFEKAAPSGPCTPGLGIVLFFLLPWLSAVLLITNAVKFYKGKKENKIPAIIHAVALITYLLIFYISICQS